MITDALVGWWASFVGWAGALVTLPAPPAFLGQIGGFASTAGSYVGSTGAWMPWTLLGTVIGVWAACLLAGLIIKGVRIVLSFLSAGGGSAA